MSYNAIHPGKVWLDTSGKPIQAHGFSVRKKAPVPEFGLRNQSCQVQGLC